MCLRMQEVWFLCGLPSPTTSLARGSLRAYCPVGVSPNRTMLRRPGDERECRPPRGSGPSTGCVLAGRHGCLLDRPVVHGPVTAQDETSVQGLDHGQGVESPATVGVEHVEQHVTCFRSRVGGPGRLPCTFGMCGRGQTCRGPHWTKWEASAAPSLAAGSRRRICRPTWHSCHGRHPDAPPTCVPPEEKVTYLTGGESLAKLRHLSRRLREHCGGPLRSVP